MFRIKTRSRKVTEAQPAVGRSVRRKRKFAAMGQSFGEVKRFPPLSAGKSTQRQGKTAIILHFVLREKPHSVLSRSVLISSFTSQRFKAKYALQELLKMVRFFMTISPNAALLAHLFNYN